MSRRHSAVARVVKPDPKYQSVLLAKFINHVMSNGAKSVAERIIYGALDHLEIKHGAQAYDILVEGVKNVVPNMELKSVRSGGANYQVPFHVDERRGATLALRWIVDAASARSERNMCEKLSGELFDAFSKRCAAIKKMEDVHKMADANKVFAHLATANR